MKKKMTTEQYSPETIELAEKFNLQPKDIQEIRDQGFQIEQHVDLPEQGSTNRTIKTNYKRGHTKRDVVLKIPKFVDPLDSFNSSVNTERKDLNANQARIQSEIGVHPRIATIFATIPTQDGRTIVVELAEEGGIDLVAPSLKRKIKDDSPIRNPERAAKFIDDLLDPCLFLAGKSIVHRDLKPSNILMSSKGPVITDCQNATYKHNIRNKHYPSKGGTSFSSPDLINPIMEGEIGAYREEHEVHSIGAVALYALTGKEFGYHIDLDPDGTHPNSRPVKVSSKQGTRTFHIRLTSNGEDLETVTRQEHEKRARNMIRAMDPVTRRRYGKTLERCVIPWHKDAITSRHELADEIKRINSSSWVRLREKVLAGAEYFLPTLAASTIIVGAVAGLIGLAMSNPPQEPPTVQEMLDPRRGFGLDLENHLTDADKKHVYSVLVPYMEKAKRDSEKIFDERMERNIMSEVKFFLYQIHGMDKRLSSAWLRACYLNRDLVEMYGKDKNGEPNRSDLTFVPMDFIMENPRRDNTYLNDKIRLYYGINYLKLCLGPDRTAEEVLVEYFSDSITVNTKIAKTGCLTYLPRVEDDGTVKSGFHSQLPPYQQELINTALALYMITDNEGKVHYDWIPRVIPRMGPQNPVIVVEDIHEKRALKSIAPVEKK